MRILFLLPALLVGVEPLTGQCTGSDRTPNFASVDKIFVIGPQAIQGEVTTAMGMWNAPACNPDGEVFPKFVAGQPNSIGRKVTVVLNQGLSPRNQDTGTPEGFSCGGFNGQTINLYSHVKGPRGTESCGSGAVLAQTLAHEMGHVLGLVDQGLNLRDNTCNGFIMSQRKYNANGQLIPRSIKPEECQMVDDTHLTPAEPGHPSQQIPPGGPGADPQTVPHDTEPCGTPLVIDLSGDGFRFIGPRQGVSFDIDGDGEAERLTWTDPRGDEAFLVLDRNGNGLIDDGSELFGDVTPQLPSDDPNGFQALAVFDRPAFGGNGDGLITAADAVWPRLQLWRDENHDGVTQLWELSTPGQHGITAFHLHYIASRRIDHHGNWLRWASWVEWGGRRRLAAIDVIFQSAE
jgi:hypothetical protein